MTRRIFILLLILTAFVIVPFVFWEESLVELSNHLLETNNSRWIIAAVIISLLALDILLPVPSSVLSVAGGAYLGLTLGSIVCLIGMTLGCILGHFLGFWLGKDKIRYIVSLEDQENLNKYFNRRGARTLTLARPIPVFAEVSVVMAGISRMRFSTMLLYTVPANLGISLAYAAVGNYSMQIDSFLLAFFGAIVIPVILYCLLRLMKRLWPGFSLGDAVR